MSGVLDPNDLIDTTGVGLQEGALAAILLTAAVVIGALVRRLVSRAAGRWSRTRPDVAVFLGRIVGWLIILLGLVASLMILGFQLGPMFLIIGVLGVIAFLSARTLLGSVYEIERGASGRTRVRSSRARVAECIRGRAAGTNRSLRNVRTT